ncbi:hypothetical protein BGZ65_001852 [Modicella reniformis]|uniref:Cysteine synthase 1 n=1 Tax=Modicella reniformis TaxID=1440133 RepID=A0A9P6INK8_9FUNG|nr:hypothetical protein BGZ65_001852 [Modicella reniformis]
MLRTGITSVSKRSYTTFKPLISAAKIRLNKLSEETGSNIYGKAEFMNPGGSVKDRAALYVVKDAEEKGLIKPGGTVVEGTAGNTGIGLAHVCRAKGYKCIIYMPNTQSQEKIDLLRMLGAEVYPVPAVAFDDPQNYNHQAARHAKSIENAVWTNQFDNRSMALPVPQEKSQGKTQIFLADPPGSVLYSYFKSGGKLTERSGSSITEGIGQGRVTDNLKPDIELIDDALHIPDEDSLEMIYRLLDEEGIYVGASSALNVVAAVKMAQQLGPGKNIVTILCDGAYRYQSRLFSKKWIESKGLTNAIPEHLKKYATLD